MVPVGWVRVRHEGRVAWRVSSPAEAHVHHREDARPPAVRWAGAPQQELPDHIVAVVDGVLHLGCVAWLGPLREVALVRPAVGREAAGVDRGGQLGNLLVLPGDEQGGAGLHGVHVVVEFVDVLEVEKVERDAHLSRQRLERLYRPVACLFCCGPRPLRSEQLCRRAERKRHCAVPRLADTARDVGCTVPSLVREVDVRVVVVAFSVADQVNDGELLLRRGGKQEEAHGPH
mmetsp:Transcript_4680/g.15215  ORF Transcript_4680/g.15215 Transcript_4680/m.15215 type:complete len:231 (+) Transcript_4680:765-1457(+)